MAFTPTNIGIHSIKNPKRRQISEELQTAANAMTAARESLEATQAAYELAFQRFKAAHDFLAKEVRETDSEGNEQTVTTWMLKYFNLREYAYTALSLGDAIGAILEYRHRDTGEGLHWLEIVSQLQHGGFQFKTGSPLREANAALLKLKNVESDDSRNYRWIPPQYDEAGNVIEPDDEGEKE